MFGLSNIETDVDSFLLNNNINDINIKQSLLKSKKVFILNLSDSVADSFYSTLSTKPSVEELICFDELLGDRVFIDRVSILFSGDYLFTFKGISILKYKSCIRKKRLRQIS